MTAFNLDQYLSEAIELLIKDALRGTLKNPRETAFFVQYGLAAKKAAGLRRRAAEAGGHIPAFLIASITDRCNLNCAGCYSRAQTNREPAPELGREDWARVFKEACELGISAILLAGGEPLMRADVLEEATRHPSILFPVFTNGTMLKDTGLFEKHRHLFPVISIEGNEVTTDARRGAGVYTRVMQVMESLKSKDLPFGLSVTVTNKNIAQVTAEKAAAKAREMGCKAIVFVEYVPITGPELALDDAGRRMLAERAALLRERQDIIIISFPGDEKESGGCLAAGRGFFHINARGGAEPCPFSPYSDSSVKTLPLRDVLQSPLFTRLRETGALFKEHSGGCALFEQAAFVQALSGKN
ncbi:MAG: radical SAM protein [Treponema sp.]|jgi:MoaA/NifB/PqqE/SkfB family radical SAM enzyme|nr:radical SAM protein [Treponema sp.]